MVSITRLEYLLIKMSKETGLFEVSYVYKQGRDRQSKPSYVEIQTKNGWFEILANGYGATSRRQIGGDKWSDIKEKIKSML